MTEQPGALPPQQNQGVPEPTQDPVTDAELRAAIEHVLRSKGSRVVAWANATIKKLDALLTAGVPDPVRRQVWVTMLTQFLKQRSVALATGLIPQFAPAVTTGFANMCTAPHGILQCHVLPTPDKATVSQIEGFVYETEFYIGAEQAVVDIKDEFAEYVQRPTTLEPLLKMFLATLDEEHALLDTTVRDARAALQDIHVKQLGPFLQLLVTPLTTLCQKGEALLSSNARPEVVKAVDAGLIPAFASPLAAQKQVIVNLVPAASSACHLAQVPLSMALLRLDGDLLQRLAPLAALTGAHRSACLNLLGVYKVPWITCMASLTTPELTLLTSRCTHKEVRDALTKRVTHANINDLSKVVQVIINPVDDWDVACGKVHSFGYAEITLPHGVTAHAWLPIGQCWVPGAFSTGAMETDLVCLKHMAEELGPNPSPAKAAAYFADLVEACLQACSGWSGRGSRRCTSPRSSSTARRGRSGSATCPATRRCSTSTASTRNPRGSSASSRARWARAYGRPSPGARSPLSTPPTMRSKRWSTGSSSGAAVANVAARWGCWPAAAMWAR